MLLTFALAVFGWIIFRAQDISQFGEVISTICSDSLLSVPWLRNRQYYVPKLISVCLMLIVEWINRTEPHGLGKIYHSRIIRVLVYYLLIGLMMYMQPSSDVSFIYFQF